MNIEKLNELATWELLAIKAAIEEELKRRAQEVDELVVYQHDCFGSAGYHMTRKKHWCKVVKSIDPTKSNGFAFIGDFLPTDRQTRVKSNSIVIEACGDKICAYRVTKEGKKLIAEGRTNSMIEFIDKVVVALK